MEQSINQNHRHSFLAVSSLLFATTALVYLPVILHGGFIWDDPQHITSNLTLRDLPGLAAIWIHPSSLPQYYPLVHTSFWIEYHLWAARPIGYHIDNVLLHAFSTILLWLALRRLQIPGALLAAAFFALHPVQVESVAWATERKNVLSAAFYLLSLHAYLNWTGNNLAARSPRLSQYFLSLGLFIAALLSKSVACSLPAAILLLIYWRRGRITLRDFRPLIPFFIIGLAMAAVTGLIERNQVGASGPQWNWTFPDRCLIAARAIWFYAAKLFWPHSLIFIYPKWPAMSFTQQPKLVLFPAATLGLLAALWLLRRRIGRGPLVAILFFVGTLLPALGFINIYTMRFSFVADHFQYLASIGLFVLTAAILQRWLFTRVLAIIVLILLASLTWTRQSIYENSLTLWQATAEKNPTSWMVQSNLADHYDALAANPALSADDRAQLSAHADSCHARALELAPDQGILHWKWGIVQLNQGDLESAKREFAAALKIDPTAAPALDSMGSLLLQQRDSSGATDYFRRAAVANPKYPPGLYHYGQQLQSRGDIDGAISQYTAAANLWPENADLQFDLANQLFVNKARPDLAIPHYAAAITSQPNRPDLRIGYAAALRATGQLDQARDQCRQALQIDPDFQPAEQLWQALQK